MAPELDTTQLPLIVTRFGDAAPSDDEYAAYLERLTQIAREHNPHVSIVIVEGQHPMSPKQREMQSAWLRAQAELLRTSNRGTAFVFESPLQRLILKSVFVLQRMPTPYKICGSLEEARMWAQQRLAAGSS